jgi:hypothetical protein
MVHYLTSPKMMMLRNARASKAAGASERDDPGPRGGSSGRGKRQQVDYTATITAAPRKSRSGRVIRSSHLTKFADRQAAAHAVYHKTPSGAGRQTLNNAHSFARAAVHPLPPAAGDKGIDQPRSDSRFGGSRGEANDGSMLHDLFQVLLQIALVLVLILTPLLYSPLHTLCLLLLCSCRRAIVAGRV